uniref:Uncharacterized protein n=1 Tax=Arundo donax TaxID=35708 RepID=A0A0A9BE79_ARUDO
MFHTIHQDTRTNVTNIHMLHRGIHFSSSHLATATAENRTSVL